MRTCDLPKIIDGIWENLDWTSKFLPLAAYFHQYMKKGFHTDKVPCIMVKL